ncbi:MULTISPECIES: glycosyltransferase [unclassified Embleya]|uniref:glycosyltransferase n=1 Tax=unclassified Embleya TaxID=2699296 RepID=UPI0033D35DE5
MRTTRTRHVFFVGIDVDSLGGSQRVIHTLAQGLGGRGHRVEVVGIRTAPEPFRYHDEPTYEHTTLYPDTPAAAWHAKSLTERLSPTRNLSARRNKAARTEARAKLQARFDAVPEGFVVFGSPWAADWVLPLHWPQLKGIGQYHESFLQARTSENKDLILRHYPLMSKALFLSQGDADEFTRLRLPNAGVMPNPLSFYPDAVAPAGTRRVAAVGRLEGIKRLERLLWAFAEATRDAHQDWELHLMGDGPQEDYLRETAVELGIADRVIFRGRVSDMSRALREVDIVALSSEKEGRPMALAEAAACGVPVVSFDLSAGVRELVDDGVTGVLVPSGDMPALARALERLIADPELRCTYGKAAREHVRPYALEAVLDRWEDLFDEIDR